MRLQDVLDEALDILMHNEFKTFGNLQKARYQNNKSEDEIWLRHDMYANTIQDPAQVKKQSIIRKANAKTKKGQEAIEKGRKARQAWYKNPKNHQAFLEKIKKRDQLKKFKKNQ